MFGTWLRSPLWGILIPVPLFMASHALLTSTLPTLLITAGLWWWYSRREGLGLWEPARGTGQRLRGSGRARAGSGD